MNAFKHNYMHLTDGILCPSTHASLRISMRSPFSKVSSPADRPWKEYGATTMRPRPGVDGASATPAEREVSRRSEELPGTSLMPELSRQGLFG